MNTAAIERKCAIVGACPAGLSSARALQAKGAGGRGRKEQADLVASFIKACEDITGASRELREAKQELLPDVREGYEYVKQDRMACYVHCDDTCRAAVRKYLRAFG